MRDLLILLFALAGGLTLSGIVANIYRILARKPDGGSQTLLYYAVMVLAGPSVLFNNATRSFRSKSCSLTAYAFAVMVAAYWSFALGVMVLSIIVKA